MVTMKLEGHLVVAGYAAEAAYGHRQKVVQGIVDLSVDAWTRWDRPALQITKPDLT